MNSPAIQCTSKLGYPITVYTLDRTELQGGIAKKVLCTVQYCVTDPRSGVWRRRRTANLTFF